MPGVPREFAEHALNVFPDTKPVKQSIRRLSEPRAEAIGMESIDYSLQTHQGDQRKRVARKYSDGPQEGHGHPADVRRLHVTKQALPKGPLPSPSDRSDHRFDCRCEKLSFLDAYSGYN